MDKLQIVLASVVTLVWVASIIVRVLLPSNHVDFGVLDTVVLLVFGFIFGVGAIKKKPTDTNTESVPK
jgi:uncharacterized membrane-anchored protein